MWQADPEGVTILDVRTPEEWVFTRPSADGHVDPLRIHGLRMG